VREEAVGHARVAGIVPRGGTGGKGDGAVVVARAVGGAVLGRGRRAGRNLAHEVHVGLLGREADRRGDEGALSGNAEGAVGDVGNAVAVKVGVCAEAGLKK